MKLHFAIFALVSSAIASTNADGEGAKCSSDQTVVCKDNGNGLLTLGNVAPGILGQSCSGGNVYCCSTKDVNEVRPHKFFELIKY